ncbi:putative ATP-dependent RNA helicase SoYb [Drosophila tropicalis]|uniref:putative ATP-dependent RNA helicase SoYb n=1 Tax=Drosophila tropicalis TaxID=46794 RepID=UPI0035AC17D3
MEKAIRFDQILKAFRGSEDGTNVEENVEPEDTKNVLGQENPELDDQQQVKSEEEEESSSPTPGFEGYSPLKRTSLKLSNSANWSGKENIFKVGHHTSHFKLITWSCSPLISKNYLMGVPGISSEIKLALKNLKFCPDRAQFGQRYAWPHLASGGSMIMIGHEKRGKSWSFIPILCQRLYEATLIDGPPDWTGPKCIMLVANPKEILKAFNLLLEILSFCASDKINTFVTFETPTDMNDVITKLSKPCGILITTVELIMKLIKRGKKRNLKIFQPKALRCLILDNIGDMWHHSPLSTIDVLRWLTDKFVFTKEQTQLIITGRLWMDDIMKCQIIPQLSDVLLILEDGLEATIYGGIKLSINFVTQEDYRSGEALLKVLSGRDLSKERIVIVCYQAFDCLQIQNTLMSHGIPHIKSGEELQETKTGIIIAIDNMLYSLNCGPVDLLVSYTLTHTWSRYKQRFNLFHANYTTQVKTPGEALIIVNPSQMEELWLFCDFLFKHDLDVPQNWLDRVFDCRLEKEKVVPRRNANLCQQFVYYGNCYRRRCRYRHMMTSDEVKPAKHLPQLGKIHFRVLNVLSPNSLSINIVDEPYDEDNSLTDLDDSIQAFYKDAKNLIRHTNPSFGDIIIIHFKNHYVRAMIIFMKFETIGVKQLDWGTEHFSTSADQLFVCDERFRHHKIHAIDLILTGIIPQSMDRKWNDEAKAAIRSRYFNSDGTPERRAMLRQRIYSAVVKFTFNGAIHVDTIFSPKCKDMKKFVLFNFWCYEDKMVKDRLANISAQLNDAN